MNENSAAPASSFLFDDDRFKQTAGMLIALVTLFAAVVALLQNDASARDDYANRTAQAYAMQAVGQRLSGTAETNYAQNEAYQNWSQLQNLALAAENNGDEAAAKRYRTVAETLTKLSPLLAPPYLDPAQAEEPNFAKYEADVYVIKATGLSERSVTWFGEKQAWDEKANTYVVHLTILAVALFLFGLAATISNKQLRLIFVGAGLVITVIAMGWVIKVYLDPVDRLPDSAVDAYAQGVGLAYQGDNEKAIAAFDEALAQAPAYANAYFERGLAKYAQGDLPAATADLEAAGQAGRTDASVSWNLAWLYYLQGRFDDAITANHRSIELDPAQLEARFDLAQALLVSGQIEAAKAEYAKTLEMAAAQLAEANAAGQQPPASLWWSMDSAAAGLDSLQDLGEGFENSWWADTPPPDKITDLAAVSAAAEELVKQVRGQSVALEYTDKPLTGQLTATISPFTFAGDIVEDENGDIVDYTEAESFPAGTDTVLVVFDYAGMKEGQQILYKVYYNGEEDTSWRTVEQWSMGESGEGAYFPLSYAYSNVYTLASGEYLVEMYIDSHLAQRGYFNIEDEAN